MVFGGGGGGAGVPRKKNSGERDYQLFQVRREYARTSINQDKTFHALKNNNNNNKTKEAILNADSIVAYADRNN